MTEAITYPTAFRPKSKFTKADDAFRQLLKHERTSNKLTQSDLAARLAQPQSYVSKYELGERRLDFVETILVCEALEVDFVQFAATFFGLTGMHMLHVTLGVIYLGVIALRRNFIPILLVFWLAAWLGTPASSPFHYGAHILLLAAIVCSIILWLKPKVYDSSDVEVAGLYWHFVDLVWMFIFPLVYLMSAKIL